MFLFFQGDLDALSKKISALNASVKEAGRQMGAATEDGEREHDNPELEDAQRRFEMWSKSSRDFNEIRSKAMLITHEQIKTDHAMIGCTVRYADQDGQERTISIGSYIPIEASRTVSYDAPVARLLIGLAVGEYREGVIAGKKVEYEVLAIEKTEPTLP